jgi:hypothetical protein
MFVCMFEWELTDCFVGVGSRVVPPTLRLRLALRLFDAFFL